VAGIKAFYGPLQKKATSPIRRLRGTIPQSFLMVLRGRRLDAAPPAKSQNRQAVFSARQVAEVKFAPEILAAMPDGTGAVMMTARLRDDATWKHAKVGGSGERLLRPKSSNGSAKFTSVFRRRGREHALGDCYWSVVQRSSRRRSPSGMN